MPSNANAMGFNYEPRVFCFIDRNDMLMKSFAKGSGKNSKKFLSNDEAMHKLVHAWTKLQKKTSGILYDTHEFCIFAVDTAKCSNVKFWRDNAFCIDGDFVAVYTNDPIRPECLSIAGEFNAKP